MATFYFTNFPESWGVEPLWKMFTRWGYVVDVYVPNKRNREGKMFGFVRFDRVSEVKELEDQLRMIWIGLHKLRVNLSKFSRQSGSQVRHRAVDTGKLGSGGAKFAQQGLKYAAAGKGNTCSGDGKVVQQERKYVDVVKGNSKVFWRPKLVAKGDAAGVDEWRGIDFTIPEVEMKWLEKCYVAEVHSPTMVDSVQDRILEEGVTSVRVVPMGGSQVLLKPVDGEDLEDLIRDTGGFLENWFSRIVKWIPMEVPCEHYTWIRCQGVPLHAWTAEFFESIVSSLGRFITLGDNTFNMKRFDMARIHILMTSPEAVHKVERVRINGIIYAIRVVEELFPMYYEACPVRRKIVSADSMSTSEVSSDFSDHIFSDGSFPPEEDFQNSKRR